MAILVSFENQFILVLVFLIARLSRKDLSLLLSLLLLLLSIRKTNIQNVMKLTKPFKPSPNKMAIIFPSIRQKRTAAAQP